jgi:hypothetical protein
MKPNDFAKRLSTLGRWMVATLACCAAVTCIWQGIFSASGAALAAPISNLVLAADVGDQVQEKVSEDASRAKNFIRDTADRVERTANQNAERVDRATDEGNFLERRAKQDRSRIEKRAEEDAARTEKAVDNTKNAIEQAVDNIKDDFNN